MLFSPKDMMLSNQEDVDILELIITNIIETFFSTVFIALKFWVVVPYLTSYRGTTIPSDVCNIVYLHNTYLSYLFSCNSKTGETAWILLFSNWDSNKKTLVDIWCLVFCF